MRAWMIAAVLALTSCVDGTDGPPSGDVPGAAGSDPAADGTQLPGRALPGDGATPGASQAGAGAPGTATKDDGKAARFVEAAAQVEELICGCFECPGDSVVEQSACLADSYRASYDPAVECMIDMFIAQAECLLAAGCDGDAAVACNPDGSPEQACGSLPESATACMGDSAGEPVGGSPSGEAGDEPGAEPGTVPAADHDKIDAFLELNAAANETRCACWGCEGLSAESGRALAECEADWYRDNYDAAADCRLDLTLTRLECLLSAGCNTDAVVACDTTAEMDRVCGAAPEELLTCSAGLFEGAP